MRYFPFLRSAPASALALFRRIQQQYPRCLYWASVTSGGLVVASPLLSGTEVGGQYPRFLAVLAVVSIFILHLVHLDIFLGLGFPGFGVYLAVVLATTNPNNIFGSRPFSCTLVLLMVLSLLVLSLSAPYHRLRREAHQRTDPEARPALNNRNLKMLNVNEKTIHEDTIQVNGPSSKLSLPPGGSEGSSLSLSNLPSTASLEPEVIPILSGNDHGTDNRRIKVKPRREESGNVGIIRPWRDNDHIPIVPSRFRVQSSTAREEDTENLALDD